MILLKRYRIDRKVGSGNFGQVYRGVNIVTKQPVAIKIEKSRTKGRFQLDKEYKIYKKLSDAPHWARVYDYKYQDYRAVMVMDLLGLNLDQVFQKFNRSFKATIIGYMAQKMISTIQTFHSMGYLHRDIKPQNFLIKHNSIENLAQDIFPEIYLVDYGISKSLDAVTQEDYTNEHNKLEGTVPYASPYCHLGIVNSRRDDLLSLAYVLIYFARGSLKWQNLDHRRFSKEDYHRNVMMMKLSLCPEKIVGLDDGKDGLLRIVLLNFYLMVFSLKVGEIPSYEHLKSLFQPLLTEFNGYITV